MDKAPDPTVDYYTLKAMIAELPEKDRVLVESLVHDLEKWAESFGGHGQMALSLVLLKILHKSKEERKN